ncbi:hypothetical protein WJ69_34310 [Burkholderia ubonensis]|uniref:protein-tyrosine phosphatase family protein n=1 Tax=Burkholderia ubonensis TaxID=101571 RepID=UPI00075C31E5|nr:protein-tyrosine phosphatase family protein [Burkholderia ubonensis]KVN98531.1 hypothetical protein WJ69_34310 [Burkholderia ubonensis]
MELTKLNPLELPKSGPREALLEHLGTSDHKSGLFMRLKAEVGPRAAGSRFLNDVPGARFSDVPTAAATQVVAPDGNALPANRMQISGQKVCIASQYPTAAIMESYLGMLAANRTPVLVVLASDVDIDAGKMPRYFSESGQYGDVSVTVTDEGSRTLVDTLLMRSYTMEITDNADEKGASIRIPVLHVTNWADYSGQNAEVLDALARDVDRIKDQQIHLYTLANSTALTDPDKLLPVIHCRAGVGRTGQLAAARALQQAGETQKDGWDALKDIVTDMRESRNHLMVQTQAQLDPLIELANRKGRTIA